MLNKLEQLEEGFKEWLTAGALGASALAGVSSAGAPKEISPIVKSADMTIDINKIWELESTKGKNKKMLKPNSAGALGHFQFVQKTWDDIVGKMGADYDWRTGAVDYKTSAKVADYYLNIEIPRMLKALKLPDTLETRLSSYNWGIGFVNKYYKQLGNEWVSKLPVETKKYISDYKKG